MPHRHTVDEKKMLQREWAKKKYNCMSCGKCITNGSKYMHNKR